MLHIPHITNCYDIVRASYAKGRTILLVQPFTTFYIRMPWSCFFAHGWHRIAVHFLDKLKFCAKPCLKCFFVNAYSHGKILYTHANGIIHGYFLIIFAARLFTCDYLAYLTVNIILCYNACFYGIVSISKRRSRFNAVIYDLCAVKAAYIQLLLSKRIRSYLCDMCSRFEPFLLNNRTLSCKCD